MHSKNNLLQETINKRCSTCDAEKGQECIPQTLEEIQRLSQSIKFHFSRLI